MIATRVAVTILVFAGLASALPAQTPPIPTTNAPLAYGIMGLVMAVALGLVRIIEGLVAARRANGGNGALDKALDRVERAIAQAVAELGRHQDGVERALNASTAVLTTIQERQRAGRELMAKATEALEARFEKVEDALRDLARAVDRAA